MSLPSRNHQAVGKRMEMDALFLVSGDIDSSIDLLTPQQCALFQTDIVIPYQVRFLRSGENDMGTKVCS